MSKRQVLQSGSNICTGKGIPTNWTYIRDMPDKLYPHTHRTTIKRMVECKCKCGKVCTVQYNNIRTGKSISCNTGMCRTVPNLGSRSKDTTYNMLYDNYKRGAYNRGYAFELSKEEFIAITLMNCYYCNTEPNQVFRILNSKTQEVRAGIPITYNGIDRIDNTIGYTVSNTAPCCKRCNYMKSDINIDEFVDHITKIINNLNIRA